MADRKQAFAHLHQHTAYSLLDGAARINDLMQWVTEVSPERPTLAMTDHGNMHGAVEFYKAAHKHGVKPILGFEAYVTAGSRYERKRPSGTLDGGYFHLTLLAKNMTGYQNLVKLNSRAWLEGFYMKPRVDHELLAEHAEGVIALSGCLGAQIPRTLLDVGLDAGEEVLKQHMDIFGDNFYVELQDHGLEEQRVLNPILKDLANKYGLGMVATNDGHYVRKEDAKAHEALLAIQTKTTLSDESRFKFPCDEFYVKTPDEMAEVLPDSEYPGALENSMRIADECDVQLPIGDARVYQMPELPIPAGRTLAEQLRVQTYEGLMQRYPQHFSEALFTTYAEAAQRTHHGLTPQPGDPLLTIARAGELGRTPKEEGQTYDTYVYPHIDALDGEVDASTLAILKRAEYELGVITAMGFPDYFLIVADFINWAKDQKIAVGPGRGSGAGSIVAYALRITDIEPLEFNLLFERFLNPERVSMPDFDIDFSDTRRGEVIDYVREKYGDDRVAHIATFGTMASKAAIKDAARVMEAPFAEADKASKLVPVVFGRSVPIKQAIEESPEFREVYQGSAKEYVDVAMSLEGLTRHASVHAAGVIISRDPVTDLAPVFRSGDGPIVCQYDMGSVEDLGFLKMDFLGLRTLSFIEAAIRIIEDARGVRLDPTEFPHDDPATFELLSRGDSAGVFQFESGGMVDTLKRLKPRRIQDLIAVSALYRPGPMENIPAYIRRHHGEEEVRYDDFPVAKDRLAPILEETYGIPVYQEQIMQIAQAVAGYSLGEADLLRRAMGKKKVEEMEKQRAIFERGASELGIPSAEASGIFDLLEKFANYGFNKSHSAAYGELSFQTAYLKAHYPVEFAAALLTVERGDSDKVAEYVTDARRMGIEVLPPDINESRGDFTPVGDVVRFGLHGVKNVGDGAVEAIIHEREASGPFKDLHDFARRIDSQWINRRAFEHLIQAGAFDRFGDRATLLANVASALQWGSAQRNQEAAGQMALFGAEEVRPPTLEPAEPLDDLARLKLEKDALGLYISAHPMASYPGLADAATCDLRSVERTVERTLQAAPGGRTRIVLAGLLENVTKRPTRKGTMMARFDLADETGTVELVAFSRTFEQIADDLVDDRPAVVVAEASFMDGSLRLVCERLYPWDQRENLPHVAVLTFDAADVTDEQLLDLRSRMDEHAGPTPVRLDVGLQDGRAKVQADGLRVDTSSLAILEAECPWLTTSMTIDSQRLVAQAEAADQERRSAWRGGARGEASAPQA